MSFDKCYLIGGTIDDLVSTTLSISLGMKYQIPAFLHGNVDIWLTLMEKSFDVFNTVDERKQCIYILLSLPLEMSQDLLTYQKDAEINTSYQELKR